jgi:PKD repeat protein
MTKSFLQAVVILPVLSATAWAQAPDAEFPAASLSNGARGAGIIAALGNKLPQVARFYGMSDKQLGALCLRDHDLRIDPTGRLLYVCEGAVADAPTAQNGGTEALLSYPESQTFLLHSKPHASRVIHLDFTGHTTSGTSWKGGATFTTPPYSTDSTAAFSSQELANIQEIWKRVSEDFAPWDVDVTTEEPALDSLRKSSSTDTAYGVRVAIGGSSSDWYGANAGGVAYIGSFSWNSDTPCFVFPAQLSNGWPKYVAEAVSHEVGHTVGLDHDGVSGGTAYYSGHNGWAPIMGVGYYATITQFSKGEYSNPSNTQDDTAIITNYIPRSPDRAGDDILTAVPLAGASVSATGIIETRTDADLYRVDTGAGTLSFNVAPAAPDANIDLRIDLYNGSGNLVASGSDSGMGASLSYPATGGTYYLAVDGTGNGTASTGYTDYGSLGQFSLTGSVPSPVGQPPVAAAAATATSGLAPFNVGFSSAGSYDPEGSPLSYDWDFGDGNSSTEANPAHLYGVNGTYVASLVVFDASGLSSSSSVTIVVNDISQIIYVSGITITKSTSSRGTQAIATVTVRDASGNLKPDATVAGTWTGLTKGSVSGKTGSNGTVTLSSAWSKKQGTFTFTVTGISLSGATYESGRNAQSSISIVR